MPRSTREWALRKLKSAIDNNDWCQKHLMEVCERYSDPEPEIAAGLLIAIEVSIKLQNLVRHVRSTI